MLQFALVLNPLVCLLERHLTGTRIGQRVTKAALVAHAEDVTIFETASADIQLIGNLLLTYEKTKGAPLNKVMAASSWDKSMNILDIPYYQEITILDFRFRSTVARSGNFALSRATRKVKALARDAYRRDLYLKQRIH
jgi:hypothetical protein